MRKLQLAGAVCALIWGCSVTRAVMINFDDLPSNSLIPNNHYPEVIFSFATGLQPMAPAYLGPSPFSAANVLAAYDGVRGPTSVFDMYADFTSPVNNLKFLAVAADEFGIVARVHVYSGATLLGTDNIIGTGPSPGNFGFGSTPVDLSAYANITRIEVVPPIGQLQVDESYGGGGLVYDNFTFEPVPEPSSVALIAMAGVAMLRRKSRRVVIAIVLSISLAQLSGGARAGLIAGVGGATSWPNWVGPNTQNFDSAPTGLFNSQLLGNTKFIGVDGPLDISPNYMGQFNTTGVNSLQSGMPFNPIKPNVIEFDFTTPVGAAAWNWGAADNAWLMSAYDIGNNLIESHIITLPFSGTNAGEYFGIEASGIKKIILQDQLDNYPDGDHVFIDDFTTSFETVPEPFALAPIALCGLALRRKARKS